MRYRGRAAVGKAIVEQPGDLPAPSKTDTDVIKARLAYFRAALGCNCDLDNWQPTQKTGHTFVCRIHNAVLYGHDVRY